MPKKKTPVRGTGNPSEEYLASLYDRVHLRLPKGYLAALKEEAGEDQGDPDRPRLPEWVADAVDNSRKKKGKPPLPRKK